MASVTEKLKFSLSLILIKKNIYSYWLRKVTNCWLLYRTAQLYRKGPRVIEFER